MRRSMTLLASVAAIALSTSAFAQEAPAAEEDTSAEEIIVTAVAKGTNKLDTSISVSSLSQDAVQQFAPRSVAEVFRNLPGIRSESSGGEGNANIAVRGLPVATGGAKYIQLQEDGLGVLEFGDIIFGNADIFLRSDFNVARVESVRGGSSSTFASNAPGGVINLISNTGEKEGGAIQASAGLDYDEYRLDFRYGGRLSDSVRFHFGGFYREGEGPRKAGFDANRGFQIKGNVTKELDKGYVRLNFKYLDDRAVSYLPSPVRVTGTNKNPKFSNLPGLDANNESLATNNFTRHLGLDAANNPRVTDVTDGMRPLVKSVGLDAQYEIADGLTLSEKFKYSDVSGRFVGLFPSGFDTAQNVANSIGGAGSTLSFANGPRAGQAFAGTNGIIPLVLFNVELNNLDNVANDIRLTKTLDAGEGKVDLTVGFYKSRQTVNTTWDFSSYLLEPTGSNAALINVRNAAGVLQTDNGRVASGAFFFGNCCRRAYNIDYDTNAPFASIAYDGDKINLDASIRYDAGKARGSVNIDGPVAPRDLDGNGVISPAEARTTVLNLANPSPINYSFNYFSYSVGANYRFTDALAGFARYSRGARANADRIAIGPAINTTTGGLLDEEAAVDFVNQTELGLKYRDGGLSLFATGFYARAEEQNFDQNRPVGQQFVDRKYRSYGLELEAAYRIGGFSLAGSGTYTDSKITRDALNVGTVGNRPKRQAKFVYNITPQYDIDKFTIGANIIGTSSSFTQDTNNLKLPGFTQVNAFVSVRPIERVQLSINANNLFNVNGFTEAEEDSIPANGVVRARSINGRTISASAKFEF
jgi:outer membrane receptor protein involved in Fe transport